MPIGIQIIDDCLSIPLFEEISSFCKGPIWSFGWASNSSDTYRYWHAHFTRASGSISPLDEIEENGPHAVAACWRHLQSDGGPFSGHMLQACYANAHTYGCAGQFHRDGKGGLYESTGIIYVHEEWRPEWGGELVFLSNDHYEISESIVPRPNRLVLLPADRLHAVRGPSRTCPALRVSLVFRLKLLGNNSSTL